MSLIKGWGWFSGLIHTMNLNSCQIQNHPKVTVQNTITNSTVNWKCQQLLFSTQYLSDVGGSAGLILGISAATLLGLFEDGVFFMVV